jgi:hypothetical protein
MGTRADFYVGRGKKAEWIGSTAWDGYPKGISLTLAEKKIECGISFPQHADFPESKHLFDAATEQEFRERVSQYFTNREDVTLPEHGWPWPWETSHTTDYAYAFDDGKVWACPFGSGWFVASEGRPEEDLKSGADFPDMSDKKEVTFGKRSGLIVLGE